MPIAADIRTAIEELARELDRLGARVEQHLPDLDFAEQARLQEQLFQIIIGAFGESPAALGDYLTVLHEHDSLIGR